MEAGRDAPVLGSMATESPTPLFEAEGGHGAGVVEGLVLDGDGQVALQIALSEGGFVAMFPDVPGEDAHLVEVVRQSVGVGANDGYIFGRLPCRGKLESGSSTLRSR